MAIKHMSKDYYRPGLDSETRKELENLKETLKSLEKRDFENRDKRDIMWRRRNGTFDLNWIFKKALKSYRKEMEV